MVNVNKTMNIAGLVVKKVGVIGTALVLPLVALVALFVSSLVWAQSSVVSRKETFGRLFFDNTQRSVLESVRQGVVDRNVASRELEVIETTAIEVPQIVFKTVIRKEEGTGALVRDLEFNYEGLIRRRGGETKLLINNELLDVDEMEELQRSSGVEFSASVDNRGNVVAEDRLFKRRYDLRPGDVVLSNGDVRSVRYQSGNQRNIILRRSN